MKCNNFIVSDLGIILYFISCQINWRKGRSHLSSNTIALHQITTFALTESIALLAISRPLWTFKEVAEPFISLLSSSAPSAPSAVK
ncbi:MAG: hypothetical protein ACBR20_03700 [Microcoleus sp.]